MFDCGVLSGFRIQIVKVFYLIHFALHSKANLVSWLKKQQYMFVALSSVCLCVCKKVLARCYICRHLCMCDTEEQAQALCSFRKHSNSGYLLYLLTLYVY